MALAWSISSNADEYKRTICLEWQLQFAEGDTATVLVAQAADADLLIGTRTNQDWTGDVSGPGNYNNNIILLFFFFFIIII